MRFSIRPEWVVLALLMVVAASLILYLGRGLTLFRDEWAFLVYRNASSLDLLLFSHAGHLSIWLTGFYDFFFRAVGPDSYEAIRIAALPMHLLCAGLLYVLARRRVGDLVALAPAAVLLFLGSSWMDILWPFQIGFTGAIASGLGALLLLERDDRAGDVGACVLLVVAIGWSGTALPFLAGAAVVLLIQAGWPRLWTVAVPAILYLAWTIEYGGQDIDYAANLAKAPEYMINMAGAGVAGITGLAQSVSVVLAAIFLAVAAVRLTTTGRESALGWAALAMAISFWALTAIARAGENDPAAARYVYPTAVFLLILACEIAPRTPPTLGVALGVIAVAAACLPSNIAKMLEGERDLRHTTHVAASELGVIEIARDSVDPSFMPLLRGFPIPAGSYFAAIDRYASSPAYTSDEIAATTEHARQRADLTLVQATGLAIEPGATPQVRRGSCRRQALPATSEISSRGVLVRNTTRRDVELRLRRFASTFSTPLGSLAPGRIGLVAPSSDSARAHPWRAWIGGHGGSILVCEPSPT